MGHATTLLPIVLSIVHTTISQRGNELFYSLSISSNLSMKLTVVRSFIGGNLLITNHDFAYVRLVSLKSDTHFKLNRGLDMLKK